MKLQIQISNGHAGVWSLMLEVSLELGCWCLVLESLRLLMPSASPRPPSAVAVSAIQSRRERSTDNDLMLGFELRRTGRRLQHSRQCCNAFGIDPMIYVP